MGIKQKFSSLKEKFLKLKTWYMALPKWKKAVYGILGIILLLVPFSIIGPIVFGIVWLVKRGLNIDLIPGKGEKPVQGKKNPSETNVPDPATVNSVKEKLDDIRNTIKD